MIIFLNITTILIFATSLSLLFDEDLYKTIPTVTISIPLIMMIVALFTNLDIAVMIIYILSLFLFIVALYKTAKNKSKLSKFVIDNKLVLIIYIILALYFVFVNYNRPAWDWDDFSHWARVVKNMNFTRHLNRSTDTYLAFRHYPPNVSLFLFFFNYQKPFTEWLLFYAQSLYTVTLVIPIVFYVGKKRSVFFKILVLFFAISIPSSISAVAYISLFVDNIMGILLGYAMVEYMFNDNLKYKLFNIILALMALTLTKDAGAILAIIFIIIIFVNEIYKRINNKYMSNSSMSFKYIILMLIFVIFAYESYKLYLSSVGINNINYARNYTQSLFAMNSWASITIKNFYHKILEYNFGNIFKLSSVNIILLLILLFILLQNYIIKDQVYNYKIILFCVVGFIAYLLLLLYTYICRFGEYESVNLASFDRYISTYLLFLIVVTASSYLISLKNIQSVFIVIIAFALLFKPIEGLFQISLGAIYNRTNVLMQYNYYENRVKLIKKVLKVNDTISVVSIGNSGYNAMRIAYSLGPEYNTYYIGEPSSNLTGMYKIVLSPNEYIKKLKENGVKYVFLDSINEQFIDDYFVLFDKVDDIKNSNIFALNNNDKFSKVGD